MKLQACAQVAADTHARRRPFRHPASARRAAPDLTPGPSAFKVCETEDMDVAHLHVFKAGGTTIISLLQNACTLVNGSFKTYVTYKGQEGAFPIAQWFERQTKRSTFLVATQRDPIDRFRSAYFEEARRGTLAKYQGA